VAAQQNRESIGIVYVSEDGQTLTACFDTRADTVLVKLPDGRGGNASPSNFGIWSPVQRR
jgi:hypothetical protein